MYMAYPQISHIFFILKNLVCTWTLKEYHYESLCAHYLDSTTVNNLPCLSHRRHFVFLTDYVIGFMTLAPSVASSSSWSCPEPFTNSPFCLALEYGHSKWPHLRRLSPIKNQDILSPIKGLSGTRRWREIASCGRTHENVWIVNYSRFLPFDLPVLCLLAFACSLKNYTWNYSEEGMQVKSKKWFCMLEV